MGDVLCKSENKGTSINFEMSPKCNAELTKAAKRNNRSKRQEAAKRLEHHLMHFSVKWTEKEE